MITTPSVRNARTGLGEILELCSQGDSCVCLLEREHIWSPLALPLSVSLCVSQVVQICCLVSFILRFKSLEKILLLKKIYFLIGGKLLYNVVLVFATQKYKPAIIIHIFPPSGDSFPCPDPIPSRSSQSARFGSLCY